MSKKLQHSRQDVQQPAEGLAAVTVQVLLLARKFREGFAQGREVEDRVVAESARSARRFKNFAVHAICNHCYCASLFRDREHADEVGRALFLALSLKRAQEPGDIFLRRRAFAGIARRAHAGLAIKRWNHEAGVVRADRLVCASRSVKRLADRVLGKRRGVLRETRKRGKTRKQLQLKTKRSYVGDRQKFRELAGIGGSQVQLYERSH